jgi:hypothetical protein
MFALATQRAGPLLRVCGPPSVGDLPRLVDGGEVEPRPPESFAPRSSPTPSDARRRAPQRTCRRVVVRRGRGGRPRCRGLGQPPGSRARGPTGPPKRRSVGRSARASSGRAEGPWGGRRAVQDEKDDVSNPSDRPRKQLAHLGPVSIRTSCFTRLVRQSTRWVSRYSPRRRVSRVQNHASRSAPYSARLTVFLAERHPLRRRVGTMRIELVDLNS